MAKDMKFKENYPDYRQTLKQAGANEGTHGLRYSYAKKQIHRAKRKRVIRKADTSTDKLRDGVF